IEGNFEKGQNVLVIEDLISTGTSAIDASQALQKEGANVLGVLAIFTYGLPQSKENFANVNIPFQTITNFDELLNALLADGDNTVDEKDQLIALLDQL